LEQHCSKYLHYEDRASNVPEQRALSSRLLLPIAWHGALWGLVA